MLQRYSFYFEIASNFKIIFALYIAKHIIYQTTYIDT